MKASIATLLLAALPVLASAQTAATTKPAAQPAEKSAAAKPAAKAKLAPSARKAVEENTPVDDDPSIKLSDADVEVAKRVHVGEIK